NVLTKHRQTSDATSLRAPASFRRRSVALVLSLTGVEERDERNACQTRADDPPHLLPATPHQTRVDAPLRLLSIRESLKRLLFAIASSRHSLRVQLLSVVAGVRVPRTRSNIASRLFSTHGPRSRPPDLRELWASRADKHCAAVGGGALSLQQQWERSQCEQNDGDLGHPAWHRPGVYEACHLCYNRTRKPVSVVAMLPPVSGAFQHPREVWF
ncbi:hypothetical protein PybrP1_010313, partial [[Pythium] brassicae (nom. inval.)]